MNICVLGCGAMGSIYAGLFCAAGHRVSVVGRHGEHMNAIQQRGHIKFQLSWSQL